MSLLAFLGRDGIARPVDYASLVKLLAAPEQR